jgi:DNA invertase Pin-like site-specific DNA recombinase
VPKISKEELIRLKKTFVTDVAIAKHLEISQPSIHYMRRQYGIPSRFSGIKERNKQIIALYMQGITAKEIAGKFGLCQGRVFQIANDNGARKLKARVKSSRHRDRIISLHNQGLSGTAIANDLGITFNFVYRVIRTSRAEKTADRICA